MKILIVEDDEGIVEHLQNALCTQQYIVEVAHDGQTGWELVESFDYDLILLDVQLPKLDGISFCKRLRTKRNNIPIILLTAEERSIHKVVGLDAGADDYIVKPYNVEELLARIRALLRRGSSELAPILEWNLLTLDPSNCEVKYGEEVLHLTAKEYTIVELFLRNTHRIFSQSALLDRLWSLEEYPNENTVRAHIKSLRQKLKKVGAPSDFFETIYGLGYRLKARDQELDIQDNQNKSVAQIHPSSFALEQPTVSSAQIPLDLEAIWNRNKEKYSQRLKVLERTVAALRAETFDSTLQQEAQQQAHTLKGSLGSFGLIEAEALSREIEQMLRSNAALNPSQIDHLSQLVKALQPLIEQPFTPSKPSDAPLPHAHRQGAFLLIVDDDRDSALALSSTAIAWGFRSEIASTLAQARRAIAHSPPDIILLDLTLSTSQERGLDLLIELAQARSHIPVQVARLGARGFLQKPIAPTQAMQNIIRVHNQTSPSAATLLIVDDDLPLLEFLRGLLNPWGFKVVLLSEPQRFWEMLEQTAPDLLILDIEMPEFNGIELCQVVRNEPRWSNLPILFLSAHRDAQTSHQVFTAGADDFINKPIVEPELVARILNRLARSRSRQQ
jgi:DNA-binding response OmpR family regulator